MIIVQDCELGPALLYPQAEDAPLLTPRLLLQTEDHELVGDQRPVRRIDRVEVRPTALGERPQTLGLNVEGGEADLLFT